MGSWLGRSSRASSWLRAGVVVLGVGLAVSLAACGTNGGGDFTPKPVVTITPSTPPHSPSPTPTASETPSQSPSQTATAAPAAKASGSLTFFKENLVTDAFTGTCRTVDGAPTITLKDTKNDFYGTVEVKVVLDKSRESVASIGGDFGEDSELITRRMAYDAAKPAKGTSASLKTTGTTHTITGKAQMFENGKAVDPIPFTIKAKCARAEW